MPEEQQQIFGTDEAAEYVGLSPAAFKWWVWQNPDETRRCPPSGKIGPAAYWTRTNLDTWKEMHYRGPGRPAGTQEDTDDVSPR